MRYSGNIGQDDVVNLRKRNQAHADQENGEILFSMRLAPSLQVIDAFRAFVGVYLTRRYSRQIGDKLGTVCHELLENAVNHGTADTEITIEIRATVAGALEVAVSNRCDEQQEGLLHERIQQFVGRNTADLYRQALRGIGGTKPMLGLVRICHEAGMALEAVSESGRVFVMARMRAVSQR